MEDKKLLLIDGNNIAYRAFYALPDTIVTSAGTLTNAVLGFTSMLFKLIEDYRPESIIATFDTKGPTFRHDAYDQYKINRKEMPQGLNDQFPLIKEVLDCLNIPSLEMEGFEADDLIATIARQAGKQYSQILIASGDKDILQLVSEKIRVIVNKKGITDTLVYDAEKVEEKYGVGPERIKDLLALMGDSSDNIPGVAGIGPKTARKLLKQFSGVGDIFQNIDKVKNKRLKSILTENQEIAEKSLELTRLKIIDQLDIHNYLHQSFSDIDMVKVERLFNSLEFRNLLKKLDGLNLDGKVRTEASDIKLDQKKKVAVTAGQHLEQLGSEIEDKLYMLGVEAEAPVLLLYGETDKVYLLEGRYLADKGVKDSLSALMNSGIGICGFDFKVIFKIFMGEGFSFSGKVIDLKILYLLLNQHLPDVSLKQLISSLCGLDLKQGPARGQMQLELGSDQDEVLESGVVTIGLFSRMEDQIREQIDREGLDKVYRDIEEPLIRVLADMEFKGVHVDKRYLNKLIVDYEKNIAELKQEIFDLCGEKFNINSTQQLASILYDKLNLPATKKTKTGYSTDASALYAIYDQSPVIAKILDYREQTKLKNTYIDVLPRLINPEDGRIHATYNQMGTTTGRISSNDPNLQNIPIRTSLGRQIRKAFVPGTGYDLILAADYSQIELRILAHLAEDNSLIEAFNQGQDIHSRTASEIFDIDYHQVDDSMRRKAKAINFGIIYGMTKYGLMSRLKITEQEAEDYINTYFARYPRVKEYLDQLIKTAYSCGYATTIFGRKRKIVELGSSNGRLRSVGERLAVNTPIQGSAADIMKLATVNVYRNISQQNLNCNIILNVHDELVLELKKEDALEVEKLVKESMEGCVSLKVKLKVDIKTGPNWYI